MKELCKSIPVFLEKHPRANLLQAPTIIHKLPRLSSHLGHDIYILREDLTGFALGGNKTRKIDYLFGDALAQKATTVVTMKATSFSRNAAAAAAACGLDLHVVLPGTESEQNPLSQALFKQWGTKLYYEPEGENAMDDCQEHVLASLKAKGKAVYEMHPGGSNSIGALSYVSIFQEILDFSYRSGIYFSHIIHSTSSAGTQAGLVVGQYISNHETQIIGISASLKASAQSERVRELAWSTAQMIGTSIDQTKIIVDDSFIGPGYAKASKEGENAANLFAKLEGILLDPVYTGKAAAALIDYSTSGKYKLGNVLFIHTGGNAGVYY
ncbi:pyridoxal phosphate-dependent deaminase, putative [Olavius sp. associated proteobacterium Delta 1]|nr:pyridoxal phosphate-dependent deaminase, putative [Olavius sp. associated proteobacterium Delta 1]